MGALLSSQLHERLLRNGIMLSGVCLTERPLLGDENILGPGRSDATRRTPLGVEIVPARLGLAPTPG